MVEILPIRPEAPEKALVRRAADALLSGEVVSFLTDTIYGLCARAEDPDAIRSLYQLKGRGEEKTAPILIGSLTQLSILAHPIPQKAQALMNEFWPGPLTLILPARVGLSPHLSQNGGIAVRFPAHALSQAVAQAAGPIAATSANRTGEPPLGDTRAIADAFGEMVTLILDSGPIIGGSPSTVVDARGDAPKLLREGPVSFDRIYAVWRNN